MPNRSHYYAAGSIFYERIAIKYKGPFTNDVMLFEAFPDPHLPPCHAMSLFGYPPPSPQIMTSF